MFKKIGIICAVVIVLAAAFCLYQYTDVFGVKQNASVAADAQPLPAATEAIATAFAEETAEPAPEADAEAAADAEANPVLATLDGKEITLSEVQSMLSSLVSGGYVSDSTDYKTALDYLIQSQILRDKITELGFDQFTDEEKAEFSAKAAAEWEEAISQYVSYFGSSDTDAEQIRQEAIAYYGAYGISEDTMVRQYQSEASQAKLESYLMEGKDITATEEEIRALFDETAEQDGVNISENIGMYELYQAYYGQEFWYMPEGYRGIIHILLKADESLMTAYSEAQAAYEESKTEEKPDGDEALKAAMDEAREAVFASKKEAIDDIYARLEKGEDFTALISEYNEDPGMQDEAKLADGYHVHKDSLVWDPVFTAAAFSEKMTKPGDVSDPVVGSSGIHILYYLRDIPSGKVEMTDAIHDEIKTYLETSKQNEVFSNALVDWVSQHDVVYNQEAMYALTNGSAAE